MKLRTTRTTAAALGLLAVLSTAVACGTESTDVTTHPDSGPGARVDASSSTSEEDLVALVEDAYGDADLGLHRGHRPVLDVLEEVLGLSHDELHERMDQGQNLAAVAEDVGVDPQALVDALVESRSPAVDRLLEAGTLTQDEADGYRAALEEAFTFRVTWDGEAETPTFAGLDG
ncbi:hypothetical protein [Nocardioides dongkuii]|uniref:hypothetical protein n=1 Tax=Nocardioides dongkuii TaxID=2760089 RepID=UPI0015F993EE|nr:hypothetical protein [Nocardioides dongkuii]